MSAVRKLAAEAADNGLLAPELAAGIARVKSAKSVGIRAGNWLSLRQAQALLSAPDLATVKGLRDRAILAVLLGCGLRRSEVAALSFSHFQQRDGRWCVVESKHGYPGRECITEHPKPPSKTSQQYGPIDTFVEHKESDEENNRYTGQDSIDVKAGKLRCVIHLPVRRGEYKKRERRNGESQDHVEPANPHGTRRQDARRNRGMHTKESAARTPPTQLPGVGFDQHRYAHAPPLGQAGRSRHAPPPSATTHNSPAEHDSGTVFAEWKRPTPAAAVLTNR